MPPTIMPAPSNSGANTELPEPSTTSFAAAFNLREHILSQHVRDLETALAAARGTIAELTSANHEQREVLVRQSHSLVRGFDNEHSVRQELQRCRAELVAAKQQLAQPCNCEAEGRLARMGCRVARQALDLQRLRQMSYVQKEDEQLLKGQVASLRQALAAATASAAAAVCDVGGGSGSGGGRAALRLIRRMSAQQATVSPAGSGSLVLPERKWSAQAGSVAVFALKRQSSARVTAAEAKSSMLFVKRQTSAQPSPGLTRLGTASAKNIPSDEKRAGNANVSSPIAGAATSPVLELQQQEQEPTWELPSQLVLAAAGALLLLPAAHECELVAALAEDDAMLDQQTPQQRQQRGTRTARSSIDLTQYTASLQAPPKVGDAMTGTCRSLSSGPDSAEMNGLCYPTPASSGIQDA